MSSGSDRKSAMTGVGWLCGLLPSKREKALRERLPVLPTPLTFLYFLYLCQTGSEDALKLFFGSVHVHNISAETVSFDVNE